MAQIINDPGRAATFGQNFGQSLGSGLQALLQHKLGEKVQAAQQSKTAQGLQGLGFNQAEANQISMLAPEIQSQVVKQKLQQPNQQSFAQALQGILGGSELGELPGGLTAQQAGQLAEIGIKKNKQIAESQKELKPFLQAHGQDLKNAKTIHQKATAMLENLEKNKAKFPTGLLSYAPEVTFRDPDVRKYVADANTLVTLLAGSRKGMPTNFKIKLEQLSKPNLNQPIETQVALLKDLLESSQDVFQADENIRRIKKENKGLYPTDLVERLVEEEGLPSREKPVAQQPSLEIKPGASAAGIDPSQIPVGQSFTNPKTKKKYIWDGNELVPAESYKGR